MPVKYNSTFDSFSKEQDWNCLRSHSANRRVIDFYQYGHANTTNDVFTVDAPRPRLLTLVELTGPPITDETAEADWDKFLEIVEIHGVPDSDFAPLELRD